jgi:Zn-dependent protease
LVFWGFLNWFLVPAMEGRNLSHLARFALEELAFINFIWPLLNLLPVWPLDGGRISREICAWFSRRRGVQASLIISIAVAGLLALNALSGINKGPTIPYLPSGDYYIVLLFGLLAAGNFQALQHLRWVEQHSYYEGDWRN